MRRRPAPSHPWTRPPLPPPAALGRAQRLPLAPPRLDESRFDVWRADDLRDVLREASVAESGGGGDPWVSDSADAGVDDDAKLEELPPEVPLPPPESLASSGEEEGDGNDTPPPDDNVRHRAPDVNKHRLAKYNYDQNPQLVRIHGLTCRHIIKRQLAPAHSVCVLRTIRAPDLGPPALTEEARDNLPLNETDFRLYLAETVARSLPRASLHKISHFCLDAIDYVQIRFRSRSKPAGQTPPACLTRSSCRSARGPRTCS